jgi:hypothetical protein
MHLMVLYTHTRIHVYATTRTHAFTYSQLTVCEVSLSLLTRHSRSCSKGFTALQPSSSYTYNMGASICDRWQLLLRLREWGPWALKLWGPPGCEIFLNLSKMHLFNFCWIYQMRLWSAPQNVDVFLNSLKFLFVHFRKIKTVSDNSTNVGYLKYY